jgi:predicted RNA-binding protein with RPS1 domain
MVVGVDPEARLAGARRRAAMLRRPRTILNARNTRGNDFRISEGMRVMARILHVSQFILRVEVFGFETWLRIPDVSNIWVNDIRDAVQVGEERPVEITTLTRDESGSVTSMRVSMKAAEDAPQLELREGNTYTGHIMNFSEKAYYVRVAGVPMDIRCPINSNYTMELMEVGDYVKFYIRAIYDSVPTGAILKIIKKRIATGI